MNRKITIGKNVVNDIVLRCENYLGFHAEIYYDRGVWYLRNFDSRNPVYVGWIEVRQEILLYKDAIIRFGKQKIHWNDYLNEGETQEIRLKDLFTFHGRISRANYRALSLLAVGISICVFFLPGILEMLSYSNTIIGLNGVLITRGFSIPLIYVIAYPMILFAIIILSIKRIRNTGNPIWKLFLPIYNLKLLYFEFSKS